MKRLAQILTTLGLASICLWIASPDSGYAAGLGQVGCFAGTQSGLQNSCGRVTNGIFGEEVQLGGTTAGSGGLAVNYTGNGGVPAGTVYAALGESPNQIAMYEPSLDGGLEFIQRWEVSASAPYAVCGPVGKELPSGSKAGEHLACNVRKGAGQSNVDVAVDQTTGNVYFQQQASLSPGAKVLIEYTANGAEIITSFGEMAASADKTAETPSKIHSVFVPGGIAVDASGNVYVSDSNNEDSFYHRIMKFEPVSPGNVTAYKYAGISQDIAAGNSGSNPPPSEPSVDSLGHVYVVNEEHAIAEYDPTDPTGAPICTFNYPAGTIKGMTVNPETGAVYFYAANPPVRVHELSPCNPLTQKFSEVGQIEFSPERADLWAMTFDPVKQFTPDRPPGELFAAAPSGSSDPGSGKGEVQQSALGYIFAPGREAPPVVRSEAASHVGATSARLQAQVNAEGNPTRYRFQYLPESTYLENEPDEIQALTVAATSGLYGLSFEGSRLGGPARGTVTAGSPVVTGLKTVTGTGSLSAASGSGNIEGASGVGTLISGSKVITSVSSAEGVFEVGDGIAPHGGAAIPEGATIVSVSPEPGLTTVELTLSVAATESVAHQAITAGTKKVTSLTTGEGTFETGQQISGPGIAEGTSITAVGPTELTLSKPSKAPHAGAVLTAGSTKLRSFTPDFGAFEVGDPIEGEGIAAKAIVTAVGSGELTISTPATKAGSGVAVSDPGPYPLAAGEAVEGPGIPPATTIVAAGVGKLTLSTPAEASASGALLHAGLPPNASASQIRRALEGLSTVGAGAMAVRGGPGEDTTLYEIEFTGRLGNLDVPELGVEDLTLAGGAGSATVHTLHDGGGGFSSGAATSPVNGATAGEVNADISVSTGLVGLAPGTGYRYRIVLTSNCSAVEPEKVCEVAGPSQQFRTPVSEAAVLPDHRAYELVSPAQKHGGQVFPLNPVVATCTNECKPGQGIGRFPMQTTPDGNSVSFEGSALATGAGSANENAYVGTRSPMGWNDAIPTPGQLRSRRGEGYKAFSRNLQSAILEQRLPALSAGAPSEFKNLYFQSMDASSVFRPLLTEEPPHRPPFGSPGAAFEIEYAGASADLSKVFFTANDALPTSSEEPPAPEGPGTKFNLYEWEPGTGAIRLVNVQPGNTEAKAGATFGAASANSISINGQRAYWSDESGQVFVREDAERTIEVPDSGKFLAASADGSEVLLNDGHLFSLGTGTVTDLTEGKGGFVGVAGYGDDLSQIYFVDTEVLTAEVNERSEQAQAGRFNLYSWSGSGTRLIATLLPQDEEGAASSTIGLSQDWISVQTVRTAEASPSGRYLSFLSKASLTGFNNDAGPSAHCATIGSAFIPGPCAEAFLYDSVTGKLICASCNSSGVAPLGWAQLPVVEGPRTLAQATFLTDSGRLYFDTGDSLSQFDTNDGLQDVYEWEPAGVGTCQIVTGCQSLISSGHGESDANFTTADPSGENVFFTTRSPLVPSDQDELIDLYDARVEGGFSSGSSLPPSECAGEGCQPQVSGPPEAPPASSSVVGSSAIKGKPARCKRGKVKKNGKCVKKHKQKKSSKKHSKASKKHSKQRSGK